MRKDELISREGPSDWQQLLQRVRACDQCGAELPLEPKPIVQLHPAARILIAAQAPGQRTHHKGIPFDDPSGDRLRQWLGVSRDQFYDPLQFAIIPMGFCYPGKGSSGDLPPRKECAQLWRKDLLQHLPNLELTLVIGQYAQAWHLEQRRHKTLTETVAHWQEFWPSVLPLPHPSPRNQYWLQRHPWFEQEILPVLSARIRALLL